jgi:hypothetical protein
MSDIFTVLQSAYASAPLLTSTPSKVRYTPVNPANYQGNWTGTYSNNQKFQFHISQVNGFRAQVMFKSGTTVNNQTVLIQNNQFRIGNSKFVLTKAATPAQPASGNTPATAAQGGTAKVATAVTDPTTGNTSLIQGNATQDV